MRSKGFTLVETMVAVGVLSLVLGIAFYGFGARSGKNDSAAMAKVMSDLLLLSRTKAATIDEPVGLAFPGKSTVYAQGYYRLSGRGSMVCDSERDWSVESPLVYLSWGKVGTESYSSTETSDAYDLSTMTGFAADDPVLLFTPNGKILARGLPFDGTHYHLRVGVNPSGGSTALTGMNETWDIRVDLQGNILLERDNAFPTGGGAPPSTAKLPGVFSPPSTLPEVLSVTTSEDLVDTGKGLAVATLDEDIQMVAEAKSPSGLPLFIRWSCDGGRFTDESEWVPMTFSPGDNTWKSSISWSLPETPSTTQTVKVEVRDRYNNTSDDTDLSRVIFDTTPRIDGRIFFVSRPDGSVKSDIETINGDGTGRRAVVKGLPSGPVLAASPNGEFLAWVGDGAMTNKQVSISDTEGNILQVVTLPETLTYNVSWSDDSRQVIVSDHVSPSHMYAVSPTDGSYSTLVTFGEKVDEPAISGDLKTVVYTKTADSTSLYSLDVATNTEKEIYSTGGTSFWTGVGTFHISRAGNYVGFVNNKTEHGMIVSADGATTVDLGKGTYPTFSPDESTIVYISTAGKAQVMVAAIDGTLLHAHPSLDGANSTENQHMFSPDSKYIAMQAGVWYDHRFLAIDVATGAEIELLKDDSLNKFSPQVVSLPEP